MKKVIIFILTFSVILTVVLLLGWRYPEAENVQDAEQKREQQQELQQNQTKNKKQIHKDTETAAMVISTTISVSMSLSVTSVPRDCANGIRSYCSSITQRETSPTRGTTRFAAYAMNIEYTLVDAVGCSPRGASERRQRQPLITWLITPKKVEAANHARFISLRECQSCEKSKSSYIMYRIRPPNINGNSVFNDIFKIFFTTIENFNSFIYLCIIAQEPFLAVCRWFFAATAVKGIVCAASFLHLRKDSNILHNPCLFMNN